MKSFAARFSRRTAWDLTPNAFHEARVRLEKSGTKLIDLTESNPTRCGVNCPPDILQFLSDTAALRYDPSPKGDLLAREAVAAVYERKGTPISPEQIVLTAGTSEAYSHLFKVLADPQDQILIPRPSYPLFGHLAQLNDLVPVDYPLVYEGRWRADLDALERLVTPKTRAIVVVHPNNPTGSLVDRASTERLRKICLDHQLALISDEVFAEYCDPTPDCPKTLLGIDGVVTFSLGGASKFMALPQMKLAWVAVAGPPPQREELLARLEMIADTYLTVNTPVQLAWPHWIRHAPSIQRQINDRVRLHRKQLQEIAAKSGAFELLAADGGWCAVLRSSAWHDEESFVLRALEEQHVVVHPGYFFDFEESGILVVSLLPPPDLWKQGIERITLVKQSSAC